MMLGVSHQRPEIMTEERLCYLHAMGVEAMEVRVSRDKSSLPELEAIRERVEKAGFELFEVMLSDLYGFSEAAIGGPERDRDIDFFCDFLGRLGKAGIDKTTYSWHFEGMYKTGMSTTRGCETRLFDLADAKAAPNTYDREYDTDEVWDNYTHFIKRVLPEAESNGVRLQLHPNDPPIDHCGVARLFSSTAGYRRAMEIAGHSRYSGILFCVGCWAEMVGPDGKGEDIVAAIEEFGARGQIIQVHFRNIDSPLPRFIEVFPDNGYLDMSDIMNALHRVGFSGMAVPDHVPRFSDSEAGFMASEAFIFGYIRALMQSTKPK
jgi:mannonate dehydratase